MEEIKQSTVNSEQSTEEQKTPITVHSNQPTSLSPSTFLITLLSVLLLISCFIAGLFAYQTQKLVKELTVYKLQSTQTPTPRAIVVPTLTSHETPIATGSATPISSPVACTEEAKICPDGSSVGRSGPNCEFTPCPTTSPQP